MLIKPLDAPVAARVDLIVSTQSDDGSVGSSRPPDGVSSLGLVDVRKWMAPSLVYVHGIGNRLARVPLTRQWDAALFGEDSRSSSHMAYWADLRYSQPLPESAVSPLASDGPLPVPESAGGGGSTAAPETFVEAVLQEVASSLGRAAPESGPEAAASPPPSLAAWGQRMTYVADALARGAAPSAAEPEVFPGPRAVRQAVFRALVERALQDVYAYFFGGQREPVQDRLREVLSAVDGPVVVVAHSLGSVVAHDVLRSWQGPAREVPLLVTLGSPLGTEEIQDLLVRPLQVPAGTGRWLNACDRRDVVALDPTLRREFPPAELVTDSIVDNDSDNHHGIEPYLRAAVVQQAVHAALAG
jgi:hypothetical protein